MMCDRDRCYDLAFMDNDVVVFCQAEKEKTTVVRSIDPAFCEFPLRRNCLKRETDTSKTKRREKGQVDQNTARHRRNEGERQCMRNSSFTTLFFHFPSFFFLVCVCRCVLSHKDNPGNPIALAWQQAQYNGTKREREEAMQYMQRSSKDDNKAVFCACFRRLCRLTIEKGGTPCVGGVLA
jgi:hypothetical protein